MTSKVLIGGFREQLICFGKWHFLNILFLSPRGFYSRLDFPLFFKVIDLDSCWSNPLNRIKDVWMVYTPKKITWNPKNHGLIRCFSLFRGSNRSFSRVLMKTVHFAQLRSVQASRRATTYARVAQVDRRLMMIGDKDWAMGKTTWLFRGFVGDEIRAAVMWGLFHNEIRIPMKQPIFMGKQEGFCLWLNWVQVSR